MFRYYLNIGTNLGNKEQNIKNAIQALSQGAERIVVSEVVSSEPWGFESPHTFLNVGVALFSPMMPEQMLCHIHHIERRLGSKAHRDAQGGYIDRLVDIDIMAIEDEQGAPVEVHSPTLTVPHPHLHDRPFFLMPFRQLKGLE